MTLPTDRDARNALPIWDGFMMYFPDIFAEVAKVSVAGNKQYNFGGKLRWERAISTDHMNKVIRHCLDHGTGVVKDADDTYHLAKAIWRLCAELQLTIEADRNGDDSGRTNKGASQVTAEEVAGLLAHAGDEWNGEPEPGLQRVHTDHDHARHGRKKSRRIRVGRNKGAR